ncbi:MAG: hypothetical protein ACR2NN_03595 [Bryobacteraceae bacterium]
MRVRVIFLIFVFCAQGFAMDVQQIKLKNGLEVITVEDHHAPVISL